MNILQIKFVIFIVIVFVITVGFAILIWRKMNQMGKKAVEANQRKQEAQNIITKE